MLPTPRLPAVLLATCVGLLTLGLATDAQANVAPVADAGPDQYGVLTPLQSCKKIPLDGSGSYDPDGEITSYTWIAPDLPVKYGAHVYFCFPEGTTEVTLVVLDDGSPVYGDVDTVLVDVESASP